MSSDPESEGDGVDWLGTIGFVVVVAAFLFVGLELATRLMGVLTLVAAGLWARQGRVGYGWEGRPPAGFITGWLAYAVIGMTGAIGLFLLLMPGTATAFFGWRG